MTVIGLPVSIMAAKVTGRRRTNRHDGSKDRVRQETTTFAEVGIRV
jgi:hypothetical protein